MSKACQRCGVVEEDLRSLFMRCFYDMSELNIPFDLHYYTDESPRDYHLLVCKDCRADWMLAIKDWFEKTPDKTSCGSGIFLRELGATREITQEDWERRFPDRAPYILKIPGNENENT